MTNQCEHGQLRREAAKTPLLDLLSGVPEEARAEHKESEFHSHYIPYGRLCKEAHDEIKRLTAELDAWRKLVLDHNARCKELCRKEPCVVIDSYSGCVSCADAHSIDIPPELEPKP